MNSSTQTNQQDVAVENHSRSRLFTFGCSFTKFQWPTWADIISREFDEFQNWGLQGAGNCFILWSLMEAIYRNKINSQDTVAIMWSTVAREDRWAGGGWHPSGSIYRKYKEGSVPYSEEFIKKFADPDGYLIRDMANIAAAKGVLDSIGCKYYMTSMVPFYVASEGGPGMWQKFKSKLIHVTGWDDDSVREEQPMDSHRIMNVYKDLLTHVRPSVFEVIFNNDWFSRKGFGKGTEWVEESYEESRRTWAKEENWPSFEDLLEGKITAEALESVKQAYDFPDLQTFIDNLKYISPRKDHHPTPLEHLEYVEKILPEFKITEETRDWVSAMQDRAERGILYTSTSVTRF